MSTNLLDLLKGSITSQVQEQISSFLGENSTNTGKAINAALPSLIGGITSSANDDSLAEKLFTNIKGLFTDGHLVTSMDETTDYSQLATKGTDMLHNIMGKDSVSSLSKAISTESGITGDASSKLLGVLTPLVLGNMSSHSEGQGITSYLSEQMNHVSALIPAGIGAALAGISGFGNSIVGGVNNLIGDTTNTTTTSDSEGGSNLFKKLLPLLLFLLLAALLYLFFTKGCNNNTNGAVSTMDSTANAAEDSLGNSASATIDTLADKAKKMWETSLGKMMEVTLPNGTKINVPENGFENKFISFMKDGKGDIKTTWFELDRILFNSGGANLNAVSKEQIGTVAEILKAYPTVKVKMGGYTDNTGSKEVNVKVSGERATAVATELKTMGIAADRLESEGYGPEHPVCPENNTEECKAKNRRVAFRVTAK